MTNEQLHWKFTDDASHACSTEIDDEWKFIFIKKSLENLKNILTSNYFQSILVTYVSFIAFYHVNKFKQKIIEQLFMFSSSCTKPTFHSDMILTYCRNFIAIRCMIHCQSHTLCCSCWEFLVVIQCFVFFVTCWFSWILHPLSSRPLYKLWKCRRHFRACVFSCWSDSEFSVWACHHSLSVC